MFVGAAGAYRNGAQLGIDLLVNKLPKAASRAVKLFVQCILLLINAYILYLSVVYVQHTYGIATSVLAVSSAWVSSSLIVGFGLTTIYSLMHLVQMFRHTGKEA